MEPSMALIHGVILNLTKIGFTQEQKLEGAWMFDRDMNRQAEG